MTVCQCIARRRQKVDSLLRSAVSCTHYMIWHRSHNLSRDVLVMRPRNYSVLTAQRDCAKRPSRGLATLLTPGLHPAKLTDCVGQSNDCPAKV